jgi:phosphoribosylamine--glycine ligase
MKILVIGSGGREHALCWKLKQSPKCTNLYCAPGNPGIAQIAELVNIPTANSPADFKALVEFVKQNQIDMTVVGPEIPLVAGIVDYFEKQGLKIIGPSAKAAQLEGSKQFAKKMMKKYSVPTAESAAFDVEQLAKEHLFMSHFPIVIKADGLAAGKGVLVAKLLSEGLKFLKSVMAEKVFGDAGTQVVIEEFMTGQEASILAFVDGKNFVSMIAAQDHKAIYDNDEGPNTGGMGAYAPAPVITEKLKKQIDAEIFRPMVEGMAMEGIPFKGILYAGLMITATGPRVVEFNARFGDPETQVILPLLETDLVDIFEAIYAGTLDQIEVKWKPAHAVAVVLASNGYPGKYETGKVITGLENVDKGIAFHSGTKLENGQFLTNGGRVLSITATGTNLKDTIRDAYFEVNKIDFEGRYFRKDIGKKALEKVTAK